MLLMFYYIYQENIIDNFIIKIRLFLSNQSFGKYSDKEINIFLRYLIKINVISSDITKMGKFINKQYKEKKEELKNKIKNLEKKNDIYMKQLKEGKKIKEDIKNNPNNELFLENFNFNINNKKENNLNKNDSLKFNNETDLIDKNINKTIFEEKFDSNKNKKDSEFNSITNDLNKELNYLNEKINSNQKIYIDNKEKLEKKDNLIIEENDLHKKIFEINKKMNEINQKIESHHSQIQVLNVKNKIMQGEINQIDSFNSLLTRPASLKFFIDI